jgi:microcystin-dependent protein
MSTKVYAPAVGQINLNFTSIEAVQNVENISPIFTPLQPSDEAISPLAVAQYALYNIDFEEDNFGLDSIDYLGYKGGFITAGDKVNTKFSNFTITGNLTAHEAAFFYKDIDVNNTPIKNIKQKGDMFVQSVYNNTDEDNDVMAVGDFRQFRHPKGMIMLWSGTTQQLSADLPYWRLCAPPDSGQTINEVFVPNLEGSFIIGAGYRDTEVAPLNGGNNYQPKDNNNTNFGSISSLGIGLTGGFNGVYLTLSQIPAHRHNIQYNVTGGETSLTSSMSTYRLITGGGLVTPTLKSVSKTCVIYNLSDKTTCSNDCASKGYQKDNCCNSQTSRTLYVPQFFPIGYSVSTYVSMNPFIEQAVSFNDPQLSVTSLSESNIGDNIAHENRPLFYTLCYIINVGKER